MNLRLIIGAVAILTSLSSWAIDPFTKELYESSCKICHAGGAGGAPKSFDVEDWAPRLEKGNDVLLQNAIAGFKGMPPLGMCSDCTRKIWST